MLSCHKAYKYLNTLVVGLGKLSYSSRGFLQGTRITEWKVPGGLGWSSTIGDKRKTETTKRIRLVKDVHLSVLNTR